MLPILLYITGSGRVKAGGAEWIGTCCNRPDGSTTPPPSACNSGAEPWCLDMGQAEVKGFSRLCRQIAVSEDETKGGYISSARWNRECHDVIAASGTGNSVWTNYELISTQWMTMDFAENPAARECRNVSGMSSNTKTVRPTSP